MTDDDLELALREHYRRAADDIQPDFMLTDRIGPRKRRLWGPLVLAAPVMVLLLTGLSWLIVSGATTTGGAPPAAQVPAVSPIPMVISAHAQHVARTGDRLRVDGTASHDARLVVQLRTEGRWTDAASAAAAGGRYGLSVRVPAGVDAIRVCGRGACSAALKISVVDRNSPTPTPATSPPSPPPVEPPIPTPSGTGPGGALR